MKRSITLLLLFLGSVAAMGQKNIVGKVQDAQGEPIAYATVSLLTADSSLVTGAITDEKGAFSISAYGQTPTLPTREGEKSNNNYILQVSFIGYKTVARAIHSGDANLLITPLLKAERTCTTARTC